MIDPESAVYRCDIKGCERVFLHSDVREGGCPHCGGRRFRYATAIKDVEVEYLEKRGYDTSVLGEREDAYAL